MGYDDLIQKNQSGKLDDLVFLLLQEDIAPLYLQEMKDNGTKPTAENAKKWLSDYENNNLYD